MSAMINSIALILCGHDRRMERIPPREQQV